MRKPLGQTGPSGWLLSPLLGMALCLTFVSTPQAARTSQRPKASTSPILEQYAARAVNASSGDKAPINIYIERWSSQGDFDRLKPALMAGEPSSLLSALELQPRRVGVILMPGVQGLGARVRTRTPKNILLARSVDTSEGRRVFLATAEHLGFGESALAARESFREFNLVEIRFGPNGTGVGKIATAVDVKFAPPHALEVKNYETQPAILTDVRVEKK